MYAFGGHQEVLTALRSEILKITGELLRTEKLAGNLMVKFILLPLFLTTSVLVSCPQ